jgi:hypothetical protein
MERSPSTLDLLWVGLRGPVRRRPALRTRGVAHAPGGPSSSMCAVQATLALARKVRVALLFLESNCTWNRIDRKNPTANGPPPKKAHRDWTQRALNSAAPAVLSMRAHRFVRMAWQHAPSCARACNRGRQSRWSILLGVYGSHVVMCVCSGWSCS